MPPCVVVVWHAHHVEEVTTGLGAGTVYRQYKYTGNCQYKYTGRICRN